MIKRLKKFFEIIISQIRNTFGIAARFFAINRIGKQRPTHLPVQPGFRIREITFHFIIDNAINRQIAGRIIFVCRRQVMGFPLERLFCQQRVENRIEIHLCQVEQILFHIAGNGVVGALPTCHGIDKRCHAHFHHLEERLSDWKFP